MPVNIDYLSENSPQSPYFTDVSRCADKPSGGSPPYIPPYTHRERRESKCTKHTKHSCTHTQLSHQTWVNPNQTKHTSWNPCIYAENALNRLSRHGWYKNTSEHEIMPLCPLKMLLRMRLNRAWIQAKCMVNSLIFNPVTPGFDALEIQ